MKTLVRPGAAAGLLAALLFAVPLAADAPRTVRFTQATLENGLRVVVAEDRTTPVVAVAVNYDVGSRNERRGRTGFAHLFEHMMFKGSKNVGSGEHFVLIFNNGGDMNGTTNRDRTLYFQRVPSNQLDLVLFLEADRMRSLEITQENLDNQRHAVQEERRRGVDNQPYGRTWETVDELAYENFANAHSVIGSMEDLSAATVEDVAEFFRTYYAPNNAVLAIVGDVDPNEALAKVKQYFEGIPSQPAPAPVDLTESAGREERRQALEDPLARLSRVDLAYVVPPSMTPDADALSVLAAILSGGRSARLYEQLVRRQQVAVSAGAFMGESRGPGLFRVVALAVPGRSPEELEAALDAEIERLKAGTIEAWEMEKARNGARRRFVSSLGSSLQRAILLSQYTLFYGDPDLINRRADQLAAVTAADVQRAARRYLTRENRAVVITTPAPAPDGDPTGAAEGGR